MADSIIVNKHFSNSSSITESVFTQKSILSNVYREGEIVICNDEENPGLYIHTKATPVAPMSATGGSVINITSGEHIKVSTAFTGTMVDADDTIAEAFDKVETAIKSIPTASTTYLETAYTTSSTTTFIGKDGNTYSAGTYVVLEFKTEKQGTVMSRYSYTKMDTAVEKKAWTGTQAEYDELVEQEKIEDDRTYYIKES